MAIIHNSVTVGTEPTLIAEIPAGNPLTAVQVSNSDTAVLWVGDDSVTTTGASKGIRLASNGNIQIWLNSGDKLYATSAAGTANYAVGVLFSKVIG